MTAFDRVEHDLPVLLADLASARVPDYFDDLLQQSARTRQRPAWSSLERWLPVDLAISRVSTRARPLAGLMLLALVGLLVAATLLVYVGSHQQRLPAPFGPAGNGSMYYASSDGNIYAADPTSGTSSAVASGVQADSAVLPSNDGTRIAYTRTTPTGTEVVVADPDGSDLRTLPGTWTDFAEWNWSPDGRRIAIGSSVAGVASLSILPIDGSPSTTLALGMEAHDFWYLPDGRIVFRGVKDAAGGPTYGFYVTDAGGANPRAILPPTTVENDWLGMSPSPDGSSLVYFLWKDPYEHGRLRTVDIASGTDRSLSIDDTIVDENFEAPKFSPDGSHIMFIRFRPEGSRIAVVPVAGGPAVSMGPPGGAFEATPIALFSPDGKTISAYYPALKELWLLDATGNGNDRKLTLLPTSDVPTWQRVAP